MDVTCTVVAQVLFDFKIEPVSEPNIMPEIILKSMACNKQEHFLYPWAWMEG